MQNSAEKVAINKNPLIFEFKFQPPANYAVVMKGDTEKLINEKQYESMKSLEMFVTVEWFKFTKSRFESFPRSQITPIFFHWFPFEL